MQAKIGISIYKILAPTFPDGVFDIILKYLEKNLWEMENRCDGRNEDFKDFKSWKKFIENRKKIEKYGSILEFEWNEDSDTFCDYCQNRNCREKPDLKKCKCGDVLTLETDRQYLLSIKVSKDDQEDIVEYLVDEIKLITLLDVRN